MIKIGPRPYQPPSLGAYRVVETLNAVERTEDWSEVRSPARARRRRAKYPQRIKVVEKPCAFEDQRSRTLFVHPALMIELRRQVPEL